MSLSSAISAVIGRKKSHRAEDIDEVDTVEDDEEDEDDGDTTSAAEDDEDKTASEDDDEETTAEDDEDETVAKRSSQFNKGFAAALKRTGEILTAPSADENPQLAAQLAFGSEFRNLSSAAAKALLKTSSTSKEGKLSDRMQGHKAGLAVDGGGRKPDANTADSNLVLVASSAFGRNKAARKAALK